MVPKYGEKFILVTGNGNMMDVCKHYGFQKAVHVEELYSLMPDIAPFIHKEYPQSRLDANKASVLQRFGGFSEEELKS